MMSQRGRLILAVSVALFVVFNQAPAASSAESDKARLATYDVTSGETFFALSLAPSADAPTRADVVVLFDTSASQIALFREDSLRALQTFLSRLSADDRVLLAAVDIQSHLMTEGWVSAGSSELTAAVGKIKQRTPLGATDLIGAFRKAISWFDSKSRTASRSIILIGDGMSRANLVDDSELRQLVQDVRSARISVSSFCDWSATRREVHGRARQSLRRFDLCRSRRPIGIVDSGGLISQVSTYAGLVSGQSEVE